MAKLDPSSGQRGGAQSIEQLGARHSELNRRKIQADTQLEDARKRLETLQAELKAAYGTDDVEQLRSKLEEITAANEAKRIKYQASLDAIELALREVEGKFSDPGSPPADPEMVPV